VAGTEAGRSPGREAEQALAGSGFGGFADQSLAGWLRDGVGDFDGAGFQVDLGPEDGEGFADADAGGEHERDEAGEIGLYGVIVGGQASVQQGDFFGGEGPGWVLGFGFDGVDFADGVDGDGAVADGEFHGAGDDGAAGLGGGAPAWSLILVRTVSRRGVVASLMWSSPRAGRMWFLSARR